jgi:hypothetical protein
MKKKNVADKKMSLELLTTYPVVELLTNYKKRKSIKTTERRFRSDSSFVRTAKQYLLQANLSRVEYTAWLQKDDCNLFIIGEHHGPHATQCPRITDAIAKIIEETPEKIDLIIEHSKPGTHIYKKGSQLQDLVAIYGHCFTEHNCPVRVHWGDPDNSERNERSLELLMDLILLHKSDSALVLKESNNQDAYDLVEKLFTGNGLVKHEINKAKIPYADLLRIYKNSYDFYMTTVEEEFQKYVAELNVFPLSDDWQKTFKEWEDFKSNYSKHSEGQARALFEEENPFRLIFYNQWVKFRIDKWNRDKAFFVMLRLVTDYYVVARILKSLMKNVIYYGGVMHLQNVVYILDKLGFTIKDIKKGQCDISAFAVNIPFDTLYQGQQLFK